MNKLKELTSLCKASVTVSMNEHTSTYEAPIAYLKEGCRDLTKFVDPKVLAEIERTGQLVEVCFYPLTPISSYDIIHYDLDEALDEALAIMKAP